MISSAGLSNSDVTYEYSDTVPAGNVISCYPAVGSSVAKGQEVTLVVSKGPSGNSGGTSGEEQ
jgi:serine/threonine-protein kinase